MGQCCLRSHCGGGGPSQSRCMWVLCACLCVSKRKTPYRCPDSGRDFGCPPVCRRLRPGLGSACFGAGPCFPVTAAAVPGQFVSPALFRFLGFFFQTTWEALGWTPMSRNTSKILKMVRVSKLSPTHAPLRCSACFPNSARPWQGYLAAHGRSIFNTRSFLFPFLQQLFPLPIAELPGKARTLQAPDESPPSPLPGSSCSHGLMCRNNI